jgi:uncharacterized lipoprotein YddW (UPF0748 family)
VSDWYEGDYICPSVQPQTPKGQTSGAGGRGEAGALSWDSELRGFWVDAFHDGIKTPEQVAQLIGDAHTANANTLFVQVRRRGDSYYSDSTEPRASDIPDPSFDPLGSLIAAAHGASPPIEVYAWVATFPVWRPGYSTVDPARHVYLQHGDGRSWDDPENWLSYQYTGGGLSASDDLDPGHPAAAQYTVDVCLHLVRAYDIDGLMLDYVRYMGPDYGYNKVSEDRFHAAYGGSGHPAPDDANWMAWRREQVTNVVRRIYLEVAAAKPGVALAVAAVAWGDGPDQSGGWEGTSAYHGVFQDWRAWLEEGIVDMVVPMNYNVEHGEPGASYFQHWSEWEKDHQYGRAIAISPAAYMNHVGGSLAQARQAQSPSGAGNRALGVVFYSYAVTNLDSISNGAFCAALSQPNPYGDPPFSTWVNPPVLPWKANPTVGHLLGWTAGVPAGPLDRVPVRVSGPVDRTLLTDSTGFFGAVDLPPGDYAITLPQVATVPFYITIAPGRVALAPLNGPAPPSPPAPAPTPLPAGAFADGAFEAVWQRTDKPVADGQAEHSWVWGPAAFTAGMTESYAESPGGVRLVQYFDKSRMEINNPSGDRSSGWFVTNGLLVWEMVTGRLMVGDAAFEQRAPAAEAVAGDWAAANPDCPTYGSFGGLVGWPAPARWGQAVSATLARDGTVGDTPVLAGYGGTTIAYYEAATGHNIPQALWEYMNQGGVIYADGTYQYGTLVDWLFAFGYPISEPYLVRCRVAGEEKDVLVQLFERRVLTYTPGNPAGWQVEMGNVGMHYYRWRYGQ